MLEFSLAHPWIAAVCCTLVAVCIVIVIGCAIVETGSTAKRLIDAWRPAELARARVAHAEAEARSAATRAELNEFELERHKQAHRSLAVPEHRATLS